MANEGVPVTENKIFDVTLTRNSDASRALVIDDTTFTMTNQGTSVPDRPFGIFRLSPFSTEFNRIYGKIYEFQGYVNDILVKNLIPCRRNSDSVLGMYDTISGTFKTNAGTGTFTAGSNVTDDVIVYTDGVTETITDSTNNTATAEMLLSVGDYTDTQEILSGDVTRKVGVTVLNGTEDWQSLTNLRGYYFYFSDTVGIPYDKNSECTHFKKVAWINQQEPMEDNHFCFNKNAKTTIANGNITFKPNLTNIPTVEDWKVFLANEYANGTPVIIVYPLATETTETVTGQTLTTIDGDNTLSIQASIENLPIEANYTQKGGTVINWVGTNYYTKTETNTLLNAKQDTLVSGTNIKTVNGNSLLGSGDITISGQVTMTYNSLTKTLTWS